MPETHLGRPGLPLNKRQALYALLLGLLVAAGLRAQEDAITPNYKDADIRQIVEAVAEVTGKNFVIDQRVKANVTMISSTPMSPDAFYETFLSILQVYGFVAIPSGDVIKILPDANARQQPANDLPTSQITDSDEIVTQVLTVENVGAAQLVPILRPLVPQYGHLAAHPASNMLIISDRAANVRRLSRIVRRIDQAGDADIEIIPLEHATATEVVRVLTALNQASRGESAPSAITNLVADERTNSVLVSGDRASRLRLRTLVTHLDTPLEEGGNTQVRYLRYLNADDLATKLKEQITQTAPQQGGAAATGGVAAANRVTIWAEADTNALVMTAPPKVMRSLHQVIDKLDIRRAQVMVEAIIVDIIDDKSAEFGITWGLDATQNAAAAGLTNFSGSGAGVAQLGGAVLGGTGVDANSLNLIGDGITLGVGRIADGSTSFAAVLRALASDADTNILVNTTLVTMDNEEAEIKVGQEVPFLSGSFTNTGAAAGAVNPFQTIQREDVGLNLKITPQINEGDAVILDLELESSSISQGSTGAVDLVTNQRTINQKVIVDDGGIIVLGGLIDETLLEGENRVPLLGAIPLLGNLFSSRNSSKVKRNLMVFIRPKILRNRAQTALETNSKYNYIRELQIGTQQEKIPLLPREERPALPPLEELIAPQPASGEATGEDGS